MRTFAIILALSAVGVLGPNRAASQGPVTKAMRAEDPRLESMVRIEAIHRPIGEILEVVSKQAGAEIAADLRDGSADERLTVFVLEVVPAGEAMERIRALMSYRGAAWYWDRQGKPGEYRYTLRKSRGAIEFALRMRKRIQDRYEAAMETMVEAALLPPEERASRRQAILDAMFQTDESRAAAIMDPAARRWGGLREFGLLFSKEQRLAILRGEAQIKIPSKRLSPEGQTFVRQEWEKAEAYRVHPDGRREQIPEPQNLTFRLSQDDLGGGPTLVIHMDGIGGYGYGGGLPLVKVNRKEALQLWLDGSDQGDDFADKVVAAEKAAGFGAGKELGIAGDVRSLARQLGVPVYARLYPLYERYRLNLNRPLGEALREAADTAPAHQHRWIGSSLLLSHPSWIFRRAEPVPFRIVKELQKAGADDKGRTAYLRAALELTPEQIRLAEREFPALASFELVNKALAVVGASSRSAERLVSSGGIPVPEASKVALAAFLEVQPNFTRGGYAPREIAAIRVRLESPLVESPDRANTHLEILIARAGWKRVATFYTKLDSLPVEGRG